MDLTLDVLVLILVTSISSHQVYLTCENTTMVIMKKPAHCYIHDDKLRNFIYEHFPDYCTFAILEQFNTSQTTNTVQYSLGLDLVYRRTNNEGVFTQEIHFNTSLVVGFVTLDHDCWETRKSSPCLRGVNLLENVLELDIFTHFPYEEEFWKFESPLYRRTKGWLLSLDVQGHTDPCIMSSSWITSLQNTSIRELTVSCTNCDKEKDEFLLRDMPDLRKLHLSVFCLKQFHEDIFSGIPNLEDVALKACDLKYIPNIVSRFTKLRKLDISVNKFNDFIFLEDKVIHQLHNLEYLDMTYNRIPDVLDKFPVLSKLNNLLLTYCAITTLKRDAFRNISQLETLNLNLNKISNIHVEAFISLRKLKYLDLSQNHLITWPVLYHCYLFKLDLGSNTLTGIANPSVFGTKIDHLELSGNKISDWDDADVFKYKSTDTSRKEMFLGESNVEESNTSTILFNSGNTQSYNSMYEGVENQTLNIHSGKTWLKSLDISFNKITRLTNIMLESMDDLEMVTMNLNPLNCRDCTIPQFQNWIKTTKTKIDKSERIVCYEPETDKNKFVTKIKFDLETCRIKGPNYWITAGIPLGVGSLILICIMSIYFRFRSKIVFMLHLYRIRKQKSGSTNECNFDAFVCYSSRDRRFVLTVLARLLENSPERYKLCLHERDFVLGSHIVDNIVEAIELSRKTMVILSPHFINSKWCNWELDMAQNKMFDVDKQLLILIQVAPIDENTIPRNLKFLMDSETILTWSQESSVEEMGRQLKKSLGESIFQSSREPDSILNCTSTV